MVTVEGQKLVLHEWEDGAGILARYSKPERGEAEPEVHPPAQATTSMRGSSQRGEQIGEYLEALDARTRSSR